MEEETYSVNEMLNRVMKAWTEVDTTSFKSWFDLMALAMGNPFVYSQPEFEQISQNFLLYQQMQLNLVKLSFEFWQDILSQFEAGHEWQKTLFNYQQKLRKEVDNFFTETLKHSENTVNLWQIYIKEIERFNKIGVVKTNNPWIDLNNFYWNLMYEQTLGHLMKLPNVEPEGDFKGKLVEAFDAWALLYPTTINYQIVLAQIQLDSFNLVISELISLAQKGEKVTDWSKFQQLWGRTSDQVFEKTFCLEDNIKIRGSFLNALNKYKISQQEVMEVWMKMMNMPLRSEVDEVHKSIYELRKELKSLKKTLAKYEVQSETID